MPTSGAGCRAPARSAIRISRNAVDGSDMPQVPDVSAIVEQVKVRINQIGRELVHQERLRDDPTNHHHSLAARR
jgi:hypothetical protein